MGKSTKMTVGRREDLSVPVNLISSTGWKTTESEKEIEGGPDGLGSWRINLHAGLELQPSEFDRLPNSETKGVDPNDPDRVAALIKEQKIQKKKEGGFRFIGLDEEIGATEEGRTEDKAETLGGLGDNKCSDSGAPDGVGEADSKQKRRMTPSVLPDPDSVDGLFNLLECDSRKTPVPPMPGPDSVAGLLLQQRIHMGDEGGFLFVSTPTGTGRASTDISDSALSPQGAASSTSTDIEPDHSSTGGELS